MLRSHSFTPHNVHLAFEFHAFASQDGRHPVPIFTSHLLLRRLEGGVRESEVEEWEWDSGCCQFR